MLFQNAASYRKAWIETVAITLAVPGVGYLIDSSDPLFLNGQFPWLILAPILLSLQYGFLYGISSAGFSIVILATGWYFQWQIVPAFPTITVVGILLMTMIAAEFHELWERRQSKLEQDYHQLKVRMDEFTRIYQVLKASHVQLEQQLASQTKSLRASLLQLEKQILTIKQKGGRPLDDIGKPILDIFSEHASIYAASIFAVSSQNQLSLIPSASIGEPASVRASNPLITKALSTSQVASVQNHSKETDGVLVVIPLLDVFDRIWGIVIVTEMPFFALHSNTLDLLAVIGGRIGDLLNRRPESQPLDNTWKEIELALRRTLIEVGQHKNSAVITAINFASPRLSQIFIPRFLSESRALDKVWICENREGHQIMIQLLPLTDGRGIDAFFQRLGYPIPGDDANNTSNDDISIHRWILNANVSANNVMAELYQHCQVNPFENDLHAH